MLIITGLGLLKCLNVLSVGCLERIEVILLGKSEFFEVRDLVFCNFVYF